VRISEAFRVNSVAFSPDGRYILAGGDDNRAHLWDAVTGDRIRSFEGHSGWVNSVAFSPDGRQVLTGSEDQTARLWDAGTGKQVQSFTGHTAWINSVAFSPDGRTVLTGGDDKTARLWDVSTGQQIRTFNGHTDIVCSVAFSPDGLTVLTSSKDKTARLWNSATGQQIWSIAAYVGVTNSGQGHTFVLAPAVFSPDGRSVFTADGIAHLWNVATGKLSGTFQGHARVVSSVAFSPDGRYLVIGGWSNTARLWSLATGQQVRVFARHTAPVASVAFSPDSRYVLTGSWDKTARLWDIGTGQQIRLFEGHSNVISSVAFSPDGRYVLTGSWDKTARLWDADTGKQICSYEGHTDKVTAVAFSSDGRQVITGSWDKTARLWDADSGQQIHSFEGHTAPVTSVTFGPNGNFVLTASWDGTARFWDPASGRQTRALQGYPAAETLVISPDGRFMLTGGQGSEAALWDVSTGRQIRTFTGHVGVVNSVAFSPDGRFALTGSEDTTTRLWNVGNGKQLATLLCLYYGAWAVTDPDGRFDTSELDGGTPLVWVADSEPMRAMALEIFMRDYYAPRLLSRIMNQEELPRLRSIAEIRNRVQPDVRIVSASASRTYSGDANVVVHVASHFNELGQQSGLQDLRLFRNGQMVGYREGELADGDFTFNDIQLPTSAKTVTFAAYAFNSERIKSRTALLVYKYEPGPTAKGHAYLLQIGVNHYQAKGCDLHGSVTDAEELSRVLSQNLTKRGLDVSAVLLVSDEKGNGATKERIEEALKTIAMQATPDDVFFLSFSGHGYEDENGQFYILPANIEGSCTTVDAALLKHAISADELAEWLRPIDAGEMTFVLDSCQSASSVEANHFKRGPMGSRGLGQLAYDKKMRILAASQGNQAAQETNLLSADGVSTQAGEKRIRGLLSYALTEEGLVEGNADWNPVDGKITVGEWLTYAADAVPKGLEAGGVQAPRGFLHVAKPGAVGAAQIPAVFDFSKTDTFVLRQMEAPAKP